MLTVQNMKSFLLYFVGALGGLSVDWAVWAIIFWAFEAPVIGQAAGKGAGAIFAFLAYRNGAFKDSKSDSRLEQAQRFVLTALFGWTVGIVLIYGLLLFLPPIAAKFTSDGITFFMNWFILRTWVFKKATP